MEEGKPELFPWEMYVGEVKRHCEGIKVMIKYVQVG